MRRFNPDDLVWTEYPDRGDWVEGVVEAIGVVFLCVSVPFVHPDGKRGRYLAQRRPEECRPRKPGEDKPRS